MSAETENGFEFSKNEIDGILELARSIGSGRSKIIDGRRNWGSRFAGIDIRRCKSN